LVSFEGVDLLARASFSLRRASTSPGKGIEREKCRERE